MNYRKSFRNSMILACVGATFAISGCRTPPTPQEIDTQYNESMRLIEEVYQRSMRGCSMAYPEGGNGYDACIVAARELRDRLIEQAFTTRDRAYEENWDSARRSREDLEEELRQLIPNWPDIQDIISKIPMSMEFEATGSPVGGTFVQTRGTGQAGAGSSSVPITPVPVATTVYEFTGDASFMRNGEAVSASIDATLKMAIDQDGLEADGRVYAGNIVASFGGGVTATFNVLYDPGNIVETNATGLGWMTARTSFSHSEESWNAILPSEARLRFPITISPSGVITVNSTLASWDDYYTPRIRPYSDYNLDGELLFTADFAAFTAGHAEMDPRADINLDETWDNSDVVLWIQHFNEDFATSGG